MSAFITVERFLSEKDWTLSEFFIAGVKRGVGVEDEHRDKKVHGETRIPAGVYELDLRYSPRFSKNYFADSAGFLSTTKTDRFTKEHEMIWVKDVPGFEFILWHWGNTDDDTHGCYIVGKDFDTFTGQKGVSSSRKTYTDIYPIIYAMIKHNKDLGLKTYIEYKDKAQKIIT